MWRVGKRTNFRVGSRNDHFLSIQWAVIMRYPLNTSENYASAVELTHPHRKFKPDFIWPSVTLYMSIILRQMVAPIGTLTSYSCICKKINSCWPSKEKGIECNTIHFICIFSISFCEVTSESCREETILIFEANRSWQFCSTIYLCVHKSALCVVVEEFIEKVKRQFRHLFLISSLSFYFWK